MPTNNLEGLNLIHPIDDNINDDLYADLANTTLIPDLDAQLQLWTNLAFQSDEPFIPRPLSPTSGDYAKSLTFANNTNNSNLPFTNTNNTEFDMNKFLAGFALDPFIVPPTSDNHNRNNVDPASDITSLIHPIHPESQSQSPSISTATPTASPPSKRQRVRTKPASPPPAADFDDDADEGEGEGEGEIDSKPNLTTPVTASEDKRRRNTAASARFRAKKKEREVALEKKSKELETRVNELERECEALKRENGWLKGLVVGVTGASQAPAAGAKRRRAERDEEQDVKI